jgi:large subunit ribosomal protein L4e
MTMKVSVYGLDGKEAGKIELPKVFSEPLRKDLILRAFLSTMSRRRQPFGTSEVAGMRSSAHYYGARRTGRWIMMGREMARMPRVHGKIPGYLMYRARKVPQSTKGRLAHPPKVEKVWPQKINRKERKKAIMSAIAATADRKLVEQRGHRVGGVKELPIVVDDAVEKMKKTAEVQILFE